MASLEDRVRSWLTDQGYPLEMRAAQISGAAGASWDHGRVYEDPLTGKTREIDLMAYFDPPHAEWPGFAVHVVFECKHARDKPWVLFYSERPMLNSLGFVLAAQATDKARTLLTSALKTSPDIKELAIFAPPEKIVGFNLVRAHTDNQDAAFHAVRGVVTAARATAIEIGKHGHTVLYPAVIVIDTPLLKCRLADGGQEVELERVGRGMILHSPKPGLLTPVHVVTVDALPEFMRSIAKNSAYLRRTVDLAAE